MLVPGYRGARGMTALVSGGEYGVVWCGGGKCEGGEGRGGGWCGGLE